MYLQAATTIIAGVNRNPTPDAEGDGPLVTIELTLDGTAPMGHATIDGGATVTFSGWMGLVAAVDGLVAGHKPRACGPAV
ncbi:MAG: hypothetical protein QOG68_2274 [Solirubrobacteraceae bacterium]|nr:hypothetical protein [Solirubrobacteraceae bacterium]